MNNDYYGLSVDSYNDVLNNRSKYIEDYEHSGRRCSRHRGRDRGTASRILDKNAYENILTSFYSARGNLENRPTGVFFGYGSSEFVDVHLDNKYLLKIDLKKCYNNISFDNYKEAIRRVKFIRPVSEEMVSKVYFPGGTLRAGLSASNIICDLVLRCYFDKPINTFIHQSNHEIAYSRYYDDMYLSSNDKQVLIDAKNLIKQICLTDTFPINYKKTYLRVLSGARLFNTSIEQGEVRVSRKFKNKVRSKVHHAENTAYDDAQYRHNIQSVLSSVSYILRNERSSHPRWQKIHDEYRDLLGEYDADELVNIMSMI